MKQIDLLSTDDVKEGLKVCRTHKDKTTFGIIHFVSKNKFQIFWDNKYLVWFERTVANLNLQKLKIIIEE